MATTGRHLLTATGLFLTSVIMLVMGAGPATANTRNTAPAEASATTNGQVIEVRVSGTGIAQATGGSSSGGGGSVSVSVPSPCFTFPFATGKEYYEYVHSGLMAHQSRMMGDRVPPPPIAGYEQYKDDDKGQWWTSVCDPFAGPVGSSQAERDAFATAFRANFPTQFIEAGQPPPVPPVPAEILRDVAYANLALPTPLLDWNPKRAVSHGTLVNVQTWFWLDKPPPKVLTVTAAAGGTEATVTVTFDGMSIDASGETPVSCAGTGTPYTAGAQDPSCAVQFSQASSKLGFAATPVQVKTKWTGTWAANGGVQQPLDRQPDPKPATVDIVVDEVQTLVTGAR